MTMAVRNRARLMITALGGLCCRPIAVRSKESTTTMRTNEVVLSLLRTAIGLQQSPPNAVIISLSLFLSAIVMGPTWQQSYNAGVKPLLDHKMELPQAFGE